MIIQENVPLCDKNWFKTGGNARFYAEPKTISQLQEIIHFQKLNKIPVALLGEGANVLISDDGFPGVVIRIKNEEITYFHDDSERVKAGAGCSMATLLEDTLTQCLVGFEEFSGIPGSVGGSVFINIHYFDSLLSDFLVQATVVSVETGDFFSVNKEWFCFGYNQSRLQSGEWILWDATFKLKKVSHSEAMFAKGRSFEIVRQRARRYPAARTCGSFFRNFLHDEVSFEIAGKKIPFVAYYLEQVGVKGALSVGNAYVYPLHANMLVTKDGATSKDVINLACAMQEKVREKFSIIPQPECRLIGFKQNPFIE